MCKAKYVFMIGGYNLDDTGRPIDIVGFADYANTENDAMNKVKDLVMRTEYVLKNVEEVLCHKGE